MKVLKNLRHSYTHTHARRDIEIHADSLLPEGRQTLLETHLTSCADCRTYQQEFLSREKTLEDLFKSSLSEVEYSPADLHQFGQDVRKRAQARQPRFQLPEWTNSLAWASTVALILLGMVWILNNTQLDQRPPVDDSSPSLTLSLQTPPALTFTLTGNGHPVNQVAFSPDGDILAAASDNGEVFLWQVSEGSPWMTIETGFDTVNSLVFTNSGQQLLTLGASGKLQVWHVSTGELLHTIEDIPGQPRFVGLLPDGQIQFLRQPNEFLLNTAPNVRVPWATRQGKTSDPIVLPALAGEVVTAGVSPDGKILATGSKTGSIYFWKVTVEAGQRKGSPILALQGHTGPITSLAFQPDGEYLVSASEDGTLRVWGVASGTELYILTEDPGSIRSIAFSPDGASLAAALEDGNIYLWVAEGK